MQKNVDPTHSTYSSFDFNEWFRTSELLSLTGILYLLRVPVLLFLIASFITWGGLSPKGPGATILEGIYDVAWPPSPAETMPDFKIALRFLLLTLSALMFTITLAACVRNVLRCIERFDIEIGDEDIAAYRGMRLLYTLPPALLAVTIIAGATMASRVSKVPAIVGDLLGVAVFALFLFAGSRFRVPDPKKFLIASGIGVALCFYWLSWSGRMSLMVLVGIIAVVQAGVVELKKNPQRWIIGSTAGYIKNGSLSGHHLVAAHAFSLALLIYGAIFVLKSRVTNNQPYAEYPLIPTLSVLLILGVLVCWTLSGVTFFLDRYRIPLLLPIVAYSWFTSAFPQSDHFYRIHPSEMPVHLSAADLLGSNANLPPLVLVSITGGGIRASAWSARVLRELQLRSGDQERFLSSIRLISSVSGGSVGAMYFANAYLNSERRVNAAPGADKLANDKVLAHAQSSSLDDIALELVYQDTLLGLAPFLRGVDFQQGHATFVNGRGIFQDRGEALEDAIKRGPRDGPQIGKATLGTWREDARQYKRPALILNSTVVELGKRLLFATTDLPAGNAGRVQFLEQFQGFDVPIATAARLSATFPIVSPAARPLKESVYELSSHAVDGGYTDNYGMASLVEWLDNGLDDLKRSGKALPKRVLILEIRSSPAAVEQTQNNERGFVFQTLHPLLTLEHARDTGQLSHNNLERDLLTRRWADDVSICSVVFQTPQDDRVEPLNWHLTLGDIEALRLAWDMQPEAKVEWVARYLNGEEPMCK